MAIHEGLWAGKYDFLKTFLELSLGISSCDIFYRIFCLLNPDELLACFTLWVKIAFPKDLSSLGVVEDIVPIDGKVIKGSRRKTKGSNSREIEKPQYQRSTEIHKFIGSYSFMSIYSPCERIFEPFMGLDKKRLPARV